MNTRPTSPQEAVWIFIHLRKTGGTTLNGHFKKHLDWDRNYINLSNWGNQYRAKHNRRAFHDRTESCRQQVKVLAGHKAYFGIHKLIPSKEARYFTIVRDPAERLVSQYNFKKSRGEQIRRFDKWYQDLPCQWPICWFFANRFTQLPVALDAATNFKLACMLLDKCWHVGLTETLNQDLAYIFNAMGLPLKWRNLRVTGSRDNQLQDSGHHHEQEQIEQHYALDDAMRARIYEEHDWDVRLFEYARTLNARRFSAETSPSSPTHG